MKKLFFILAVVILNSLIACNSGMSATAKKNKEVNDAITKALEAGDFSKMGDYIAADAVDHAGWTGEVKGLDNIVADMKKYHEQMSDMKMETISEVADKDYTYQWMHYSGTSDGTMMAKGPFDMHAMEITKFRDGKAVEHWAYMDAAEMMKMMGAGQGMPSADTTKMKMDTSKSK